MSGVRVDEARRNHSALHAEEDKSACPDHLACVLGRTASACLLMS